MKQFFLGLISLFSLGLNAQMPQEFNTSDPNYLEDQFYLGLTYNFLLDKPTDFKQTNLSYGLQGGIIKDIPLNAQRTWAIGIGLGYAVNSYYSNLLAAESMNGVEYALIEENAVIIDDEEISVKRNKIETHLLELPFEFRWRNSSAEEYKFWRVYYGIKLGYVFSARSKLVTSKDKTIFKNPDVRKFQYGLMFNFGYNTFNVHIYYSLSGLLEDGSVLGAEDLNMKPLRVGLIFYIL
ncbi:MAG: PorT family protein [Maribacter sp.]|nr:PorT family protein [Maribacter sp.]